MSGLYDLYATDKAAEKEGVWVAKGDAQFKLARMGGANGRYQRDLTQVMKPHLREAQLGLMDNAVAEALLQKVFIDTVLLDWKNVAGADGAELPFNKENATKLLKDLPDLYLELRESASNYASFRASTLETAVKN